MRRVLFRADGSASLGLGHLTRCLTLHDALRDAGIGASFVSRSTPNGGGDAYLRKAGAEVRSLPPELTLRQDLEALLAEARDKAVEAIICDGAFFEDWYFDAIKAAGLEIAIIGSRTSGIDRADLVLNQNVNATLERYEGAVSPTTRLLLGTRWCLLRPEFVRERALRQAAPPIATKILVTMGGSDPPNFTLEVLRATTAIGLETSVTVVLGALNPHAEQVTGYASQMARPPAIELDTRSMARLMREAEVGITASGTTQWETSCVGLPTITVSLASNQDGVGAFMGRLGVSRFLGRAESISKDRLSEEIGALLRDREGRGEMSKKGMELVDGHGAQRVALEVASLLGR